MTPFAIHPPSVATPAAVIGCTHCGLAVPPGLIDPHHGEQFCCEGCRTAYQIIQGCGLEGFYAVRAQGGDPLGAIPKNVRTYSEFDDPAFQKLYVRTVSDNRRTTEVCVPAAHCAACIWLLERLPRLAPGVIDARLDLGRTLLRITWDSSRVNLSEIARVMATLGYEPHPARGPAARSAIKAEDRKQLIRLAVAGACAGNVMLLGLALYAGLFSEIEPSIVNFFRWLSLGLSTMSVLWPGRVFLRSAITSITARTIGLDVPIAIGLVVGLGWGMFNTARGEGEIYFDSLSVLVFALLVGRWIQHRRQRQTGNALELLFSLTPSVARRLTDIGEQEVPVEALQPGDVVEVRAGECLPGDGIICRGRSHLDQSLLTGESTPVGVGTGHEVFAGALNLESPIQVRVLSLGAQTRLGRLMTLVEDGAATRAPIVRAADRIASWFVICILALAGATLLIQARHGVANAVDHAVALLIVCCPCALGLATPLAMTVAIGRAAQRGMLVKSGEAIERLASRGRVYLDKTGTITEGRLHLLDWAGDSSIKPLVAAVERHSNHPVARALVRDLGGETTEEAEDVAATTGCGIRGVVNGRAIVVGSPAYVGEGLPLPDWMTSILDQALDQGATPVAMSVDGTICGLATLGDRVRSDAVESVRALRAAGWEVGMLSGDHPAVARAVGAQLGLDPELIRGGMSPEAKLREVAEASRRGSVVMVGDGVNDAAALAAAGVGIAVHGGAEASLAAADIYLDRPGLKPIVELMDASTQTLRVIRLNLVVSLAYNAVAAGLAITGVINPLIAAVLMPLSSLTVVTLSFRLPTFRKVEKANEKLPAGLRPRRAELPCP